MKQSFQVILINIIEHFVGVFISQKLKNKNTALAKTFKFVTNPIDEGHSASYVKIKIVICK